MTTVQYFFGKSLQICSCETVFVNLFLKGKETSMIKHINNHVLTQLCVEPNLLRQVWQHSLSFLTGFLQLSTGHSTGRHSTSPCCEKSIKKKEHFNQHRTFPQMIFLHEHDFSTHYYIYGYAVATILHLNRYFGDS